MERNKEKDGREKRRGGEWREEDRHDQHYKLKVSSLLILWILPVQKKTIMDNSISQIP